MEKIQHRKTRAVYIHRIATRQTFHGHNLLKYLLVWAKDFAKTNGLSYIRMDTGSGNDRLINYYVMNGFTFLGNTSVHYTPDLPAHVMKMEVSHCFQMPV